MRIFIYAIMICTLLTGCTESQTNENICGLKTCTNVNYVCVGMEVSQRFGTCSGCQLDSQRMNQLFKNTFGYCGRLLQSEEATKKAVTSALKDAIEKTTADGLFIFYYSGHGGREMLNNTSTAEPQGADKQDEYLCLYDTYLLDDEIWSLITQCKGRVFLIFDCCHSQTMFRSIKSDFVLDKGLGIPLEDSQEMVKSSVFVLSNRAIPLEDTPFNMLCWSGCQEAEYSYGSSKGGVMTNSLLKRWKKGITYTELWSFIVKDVTLNQPGQHPTMVQYGTNFKEAFR